MSIMETLNTRRTYRRFAQKPVPQDVVDDMVEALRLSSCGANRQAVKLVVVQSPEMVKKVHPLVKWAAYLPPEQGAPPASRWRTSPSPHGPRAWAAASWAPSTSPP